MFCGVSILALKKNCLCVLYGFIFLYDSSAAVKTWTGAGADGQWSTGANWSGGAIPVATDDVIFDNILVMSDYIVTLPNTAIIVKTMTINPDAGKSIQVILPSSNLIEPAFTATGPGYGLLINNGGVFQNASGMSSGEALSIADSIRISNGGKYIHHTRASHANNIARILSSAPGSERGIFEFDVPRASYTVSVSNRMYGTIIFSATAAGGAITYTCTGSNTLTVHGNMQINTGVNLSIDLASTNGNINVKGDYIQQGGIFNLASGAGNTTIVRIQGNLLQSAGAQITETNTGLPFLELNGSSPQLVSLAGTIVNNVGLRMNNTQGAILLSPLQLPYKLELQKGRIVSTAASLLTLQMNCTIAVDSTNMNMSFIDGPFRKEGLSSAQSFIFPVGKNNLMRWLELKNVSGNFVVEYINSSPRTLSNVYGTGIAHISANEYWVVNTDASPIAAGNVELSFVEPTSGGITDLAFLNVASLSSGVWEDAGHSGITGSFNTAGSVISNAVNNFSSTGYFTLASTADLQNPLPLAQIDFSGRLMNNLISFDWKIDMPEEVDSFELMTKSGNEFSVVATLPAIVTQNQYSFLYDSVRDGISIFRLRAIDKHGVSYLSKIITINNNKSDFTMMVAPTNIQGNTANVHVNAPGNEKLQWVLIASDGRIIKVGFMKINIGSNNITLELPNLGAGIYQLVAVNNKRQFCYARLIKQ